MALSFRQLLRPLNFCPPLPLLLISSDVDDQGGMLEDQTELRAEEERIEELLRLVQVYRENSAVRYRRLQNLVTSLEAGSSRTNLVSSSSGNSAQTNNRLLSSTTTSTPPSQSPRSPGLGGSSGRSSSLLDATTILGLGGGSTRGSTSLGLSGDHLRGLGGGEDSVDMLGENAALMGSSSLDGTAAANRSHVASGRFKMEDNLIGGSASSNLAGLLSLGSRGGDSSSLAIHSASSSLRGTTRQDLLDRHHEQSSIFPSTASSSGASHGLPNSSHLLASPTTSNDRRLLGDMLAEQQSRLRAEQDDLAATLQARARALSERQRLLRQALSRRGESPPAPPPMG